MNWYITRVELHGANEQHYEALHREMEQRLFMRTIRDQSGTIHRLPTATYFSQSLELDASAVRDLAVAAAQATGRPNWVLTCEANKWAAQGLPAA